MITRTFKHKIVSIIAAAAMLTGTLPVFAAENATISFETKAGYLSDVAGGYDKMHGFTAAGDSYLVMQMSNAQIEAEEKPYAEYALNVEKSGEYTLEFESSPIVNPPYTSPATVSLNGKAITDIAEIKSTNENRKTYSAAVNLTAGENDIRFTITGGCGNDETTGLFHLHNIKLASLASGTIVQDGKLIVDASSIISGTHKLTKYTSSNSGNSFASLFNADVHSTPVVYSDSISLKCCVTAPADGTYSMVVHGSSQQEYWGGCKVVIGENEYTDNGFTATHVYVNETGHPRIRKPYEVELKKGTNIFYVKSNLAGTLNGNYGFSLDRIEFTPLSVGGSMKFDDASGKEKGEQYYGGMAHQMFNGTSETFELNIPAGTYELYVGACCSAFTEYLGTLGLKVGGADFVELADTNVTDKEAYANSTIGGHFKYASDLVLTGKETLEFKTTAPSEKLNESGAPMNSYTLFDYFELVPKNAVIGKAEMQMNDTALKCGETMQAQSSLYYDNGYKCTDRLINSVKYTSSDEKVVTVDADGVITAVNPGKATVTVTYNDEYSAAEEIMVYDESGIVPVGFEYDSANKTAKLKISTISDTSATAVVIFGAGSKVNGMDTSFANILPVTVTPERGRFVTVEKQAEGDFIRAFIWNSTDGMRPVADSATLK